MTTYKEARNRRRSGRGPIFPICGRRGDSNGHEWVPGTIKRHESGCVRCQEMKELRKLDSQADYKRATKKRASLAQFFVGLPFDPDEDLLDFEREIEESEIGIPEEPTSS